ncbi:hypothetical protein TNCV_3910401 [Trichonephila clavipes]|nr:hypothetical protein TNCV_3910401 [Trichonephila clavipes]
MYVAQKKKRLSTSVLEDSSGEFWGEGVPAITVHVNIQSINLRKVYGPFVFGEPTVIGSAYLDALQLCLFSQLKESEP